jgi:hypothetical protein
MQGPYQVAPASRRLYVNISPVVLAEQNMPARYRRHSINDLRMDNTFVREFREGFLYRIERRPPYHLGKPDPTGESPPAE